MEREPHRSPDPAETSSVWLAAATLYFLLAASTIHLTSDGRGIAAVWPPNAVLVALLLIGRRPRWLSVLSAGLIGNVAANWLTRGAISGPLFYSLANGLEVVIAVTLMRADRRRLELLRSTGRLFRFVLVAGVVAPTISGLIGAAAAALVYDQPFGTAFTTWVLSDALGLLVFTPFFFSAFNGDFLACFATKNRRQRLEGAALMALTAATAGIVFFVAEQPAVFLLYPPVMLVTFRVGPRGAKMAVMLIAVIGASATALGIGPVTMTSADPVVQAHLFQATLAVMLLTCLPVAAAVAQRARLAEGLAAREQEAAQEAITDPLTGVLNRRGFERAVAEATARPGNPLSCVIIDLDRFKELNDRWGHQFGDRVLQHVAAMLRSNTRPGDLIGRLGGDEFALLLASAHAPADAVCARIQAALRAAPLCPDGVTEVMVALSCGVAKPIAGEDFEQMYRRADTALYRAKHAGRNAVRVA